MAIRNIESRLIQLERAHAVSFTPSYREALIGADQAATQLAHGHIGTEHLLLGLFNVEQTRQVLNALGLSEKRTRGAVEFVCGLGDRPVDEKCLTQRAGWVIGYSVEAAKYVRTDTVTAAHLLIGLCREGEGVAIEVSSII